MKILSSLNPFFLLFSSLSGQVLFISVEQLAKQDSAAQSEDRTIVLRSLHSVHML